MQPQVDSILEIFQRFRMAPTPLDQYDTIGRAVLSEKMKPFITANKTIDFVMLGFPMKSPNLRDKVLGTLPDLAEEVTFKNFTTFNEQIKSVYSPGINISVVSDGYVFNDVMEVQDKTVAEYEEVSLDMAKNSPIKWFKLNDFYSGISSLSTMREKVVSQFGITDEELNRRILVDPDVNFLYRGMIKFLTLDLAIKNFPSNTQLQKQAKIVAREMMFRNEAYSKLVQSEFQSHIRLSMHPSVNNGTKYSFQLIPSQKAWTSPWHCALLIDKGEYVTIHRKDAEVLGYELMYLDGRPYCFINA